MKNFIEDLDLLYEKEREKNGIGEENRNFLVFVPLKVSLYGKENKNFLIRKKAFTKFLYVKNNCRVYFSDVDILAMLLQTREKKTMDKLVEGLKKAYRGEMEKYTILAGEEEYEVTGIPEVSDGQIFVNPKDIDIPFDELLVLINLILSKDLASARLWESKPDFFKHTVSKYITLLSYYYYGDGKARKYLEGIGYDVNCGVYANYATEAKRKEKKNIFAGFDAFEKSGIL